MTFREPSAGDMLAGKYHLVAELGHGGMGSVWRADHLVLRSPVAVKLIRAEVASSEAIQARFLREAQAAAGLRSPHVVQILDYGVHDGVPFMVMELLEGESLAQRLRRMGALGPAETARVVSQVARAIQKAHEVGVVHRDLKPDNVFLVRNADEEIIKVLDFGIAKSVSGDGIDTGTQTGAVLGTPHYMSPEQARGTRAVDHRTDLWALGVIAFECMTGRRPFESNVLGDLLVKICTEEVPVPSRLASTPVGFDAWFARATHRDPDQRFQSAMEMADALRMVVGGATPSLPPPSHGAAAFATAAIGPAAHTAHAISGTATALAAPTRPRAKSSPVAALLLAFGVLVPLVAVGGFGVWWLLSRGTTAGPSMSAAAPSASAAEADQLASSASPDSSPARDGAAVGFGKGAVPRSAAVSAADGGSWQDQVAKAKLQASEATTEAKAAQAEAKKAQLEAAKARAEAAEARKKALGTQ